MQLRHVSVFFAVLLPVIACGGWSTMVAQQIEPHRAPLPETAAVAVSGGQEPGALRRLVDGAGAVCGVSSEVPVLKEAAAQIEWADGVMDAPPLHHVATLHLEASREGADVDPDDMNAAIQKAVRSVGGNLGAIHRTMKSAVTRRSATSSKHGVVVIAYDVDCDALQQTNTSTVTN